MELQPGAPAASAGRETNLAGLLRRWATGRPDAVALVGPDGGSRTWAALDARVDAVAGGLAARGLRAGHRVALLGADDPAYVVAYLAVLRAGFVAVPLDPRLPAAEVTALLGHTGARLVLAGPDVEAGHDVPVHPLTEDGLDALAAQATAPVDSPADAEALAVLLLTAGTSAAPRAVMLSHRALLAHLHQVAALGRVGPDDTVLGVLPLFHVFGLNAVLGGWLVAGARLVLVGDEPDALFAALAAEPPGTGRHLPLSPAHLAALLDDPRARALAGVAVVSGAAPLEAGLAAAFCARTGALLDQGYGLTEAAPGVALTTGGVRPGGPVGRPLPGVEVRITGAAGPDEPGEIEVRGPNLFSGYWPDGAGGPDADGWFATGDLGYLDADGELFLLDRARELVGVSGFAVYPVEVEQVIAALDGVDAVAVVGGPGEGAGAGLAAFVVGAVEPEQVRAHCRERLPRFKQPGHVEVLPELPRGATGKVRKGLLRERLAAAPGAEPRP